MALLCRQMRIGGSKIRACAVELVSKVYPRLLCFGVLDDNAKRILGFGFHLEVFIMVQVVFVDGRFEVVDTKCFYFPKGGFNSYVHSKPLKFPGESIRGGVPSWLSGIARELGGESSEEEGGEDGNEG